MLFCRSSTVKVGTIALICTASCVVATIASFCVRRLRSSAGYRAAFGSSSAAVLSPQSIHRTDARRAQCRQRARQQSHDENQQRDRAVHARIASPDAEELRREETADGQRGASAPDDADRGHAQALPENEPHEIARARADGGPDAKLIPPLGDRVADEPVEAD